MKCVKCGFEQPLSYLEWKKELEREDIVECGKTIKRPAKAIHSLYQSYLRQFKRESSK